MLREERTGGGGQVLHDKPPPPAGALLAGATGVAGVALRRWERKRLLIDDILLKAEGDKDIRLFTPLCVVQCVVIVFISVFALFLHMNNRGKVIQKCK